MTNFSPSSALKFAAAFAAVTLVGCDPSDGNKEYDSGKAAYELRDLRKADTLFTKSLSFAPDNVDRLVMLARVKLDLGELAAAGELINKASTIAPGDSDVMLLGAQIAWHAKDYEKAAKAFKAVALNAVFDAEIRSQGMTGLGIVEMTCENRHLARVAFLSAIRLDRRNASAWYHLGMLYRDGFGYAETALEHFEIFVRLDVPASPRVQKVQRAIIPALKELVARAHADIPGASKRDSSACATNIAKAEAAWKKGNYKTARQNYQDAVNADPLSYPAALGLANAWMKTDTTKNGQTKAMENYKRACMLRPSAISTFLTTGSLAAKLGYHAQAVEIYSRAVAASPTSLEAIDGLIRSLRKAGNGVNAAKAYQTYRDSLPVRKKK